MPLIKVWECPCCAALVKNKKQYIKHLKVHARTRMARRACLASAKPHIEKFNDTIKDMSLGTFVSWVMRNRDYIEEYGNGLSNVTANKMFDTKPMHTRKENRKIIYTTNLTDKHTLSFSSGAQSKKLKRSSNTIRDHEFGDFTLVIGDSCMNSLWRIIYNGIDQSVIAKMKLLAD